MGPWGKFLTCAVAACALAVPATAQAYTPVPGFAEKHLAYTGQGIAFDFVPDGRILVGDKRGILRSIRPDGTQKVVLNIQDHVNSQVDRGLTGVAVDVNYFTNRYVYLLYTYEPTGQSVTGPKTTRLTRIQVNADDTVVNPSAPETVLLGAHQPNLLQEACPAPSNTTDCVPADGTSHVGGTVIAAPDGTLYVGTGDAMHGATNAPDPFRPFNEQSYAGKILRVDRNGKGVAGHKFCPANTNLAHVCTKIYATGFRNPFRFTAASRGGLYAGDVGQVRWEELDHVVSGGSYGWPCYEGDERYAPRAGSTQCQQRYAREGTATAERKPLWAYPHQTGMGAAIIGGPEYRGTAYPENMRGDLFFSDADRGYLEQLELDSAGQPAGTRRIADDFYGVDMKIGPDGLLYSANFTNLSRLEVAAGNRTPVARATADPVAGDTPLVVNFDAGASSDPDGDALTYAWSFGDGSTGSGRTVSHTYTQTGTFEARVTVTDPSGASDAATVTIRPGLRPPSLTVTTPTDGGTYRDGVAVGLSGSATDAEDGALSSQITWAIAQHHNDHKHTYSELTGAEASFTPSTDHDTDSYYVVEATVTDSDGLTAKRSIRLNPETIMLELVADPADSLGTVSFGSQVFSWPFARRATIGFQTQLVPSTTVQSGGRTLVFQEWSGGQGRSQAFTVPAQDTRLVARYAYDGHPPETYLLDAKDTYNTKTPTFSFRANEDTSKFECKVDSGAWYVCASPHKVGPLSTGQHTFSVRAYDGSGNVDKTPASKTFAVTAL